MIHLAKSKLGRVLYHLWGMNSTFFSFGLGNLYSLLPFTFKTPFNHTTHHVRFRHALTPMFCDRVVRLVALPGLVACSASALRFFHFPVAADAGLAAGAALASRSGAVRNRSELGCMSENPLRTPKCTV